MNTLTLHVPNISCAHCVHTIQVELGEQPGVRSVHADPQTKIVTVSYEPPASPASISALLTEIDYPPEEALEK